MAESATGIPGGRRGRNILGRVPSLRVYLVCMNLFLLVLLFPLISIFFFNKQSQFRDEQLNRITQDLRDTIKRRSATLTQSVAISAEQAIAGYELSFLNTLAHQIDESDPEIQYIIIHDITQRAVVHSDPSKISMPLPQPLDVLASAISTKNFPAVKPSGWEKNPVRFISWTGTRESADLADGLILEAIAPLYNGAKFFGTLRCAYSLEKFHDEIEQARISWNKEMRDYKLYLLSLTGIFFSIGVMVAMLFTRYLVRSIDTLSQGVNWVARGNLDDEIIQGGLPCKEFLELTQAFNLMTRRLKISYQDLDEYSHSLEQKVDDRTKELKEAQDHLLMQAHEAGMAEMAVGILHNIGNAMTPAKIGATHLLRLVSKSPVRIHLYEVMAIIKKELEQSPTLTAHKREEILEIIELLPKTIAEEYDALVESLNKICEKHEHMESIIRLQLRYARLNTEAERLDFNDLVEDSLRMLADQLEKHQVKVVRKYADLPQVRVEKAKLIQIVVNLVKNAFESMLIVEDRDRILTLTTFIEKGQPDWLVLSVKDNGMGFTEEEKARFFTFGFTTKARGSGFGLHSCANYLIANQGSITAESAGKGQGAEFIIRLPIATNEETT